MDIELKYKIAEKIIQIDDDILLNEIKYLVGLSHDDIDNSIKQLLDERLKDYCQNPNDVMDFDKTISDIEKSL